MFNPANKRYIEKETISYNDKAFFILICISALKKNVIGGIALSGLFFFFVYLRDALYSPFLLSSGRVESRNWRQYDRS